MPRRREQDYPGAWWHVTNRGIAKRSAFGDGKGYRCAADAGCRAFAALAVRRLPRCTRSAADLGRLLAVA